jgi:hypothetical protein
MSLNPISLVASAAAARAANLRVSGSVSGNLNFSAGGARPHAKAPFTYQSNGYTMNASGYLAHPTHAAQVAANNAGALTRSEAASMGLPLAGRR